MAELDWSYNAEYLFFNFHKKFAVADVLVHNQTKHDWKWKTKTQT